MIQKNILLVLLTTLWISLSEFIRNQFILLNYWETHYLALGLKFPANPVSGVIWGIWSLIFAIIIVVISKRFNLIETIALAWMIGFMLMWIVMGNLLVLPFGILPVAIPLSLLEAGIASWLAHRFK